MENENLIGFERKLEEIVGDSGKIAQIMSLFPKSIIMPLFYKGDTATLNDDNVDITIVKVGWKNGGYIYYFQDEEGDLVYTYEENLKY